MHLHNGVTPIPQKLRVIVMLATTLITMNTTAQTSDESAAKQLDHQDKSILARGCDPELSRRAAGFIPPQIGNPEYVPTTDDETFFQKLKERQWSVIYFAPGACRYSAAKMRIPGSNENTKTWTLEEYRAIVRELQGEDIVIVESTQENESLQRLREGLNKARAVR